MRLIDPCTQVLALVKGDERYIFLFDENSRGRGEALRMMGRYAANPELSFTWYDAAALAKKIQAAMRAELKNMGFD